MAFPKKKSRKITVDDNQYRYVVSSSKNSDSAWCKLTILVELEGQNGSVLRVVGLRSRDPWLDLSEGVKYDNKDYQVIKPNQVREFIKIAMQSGWKAAINGPEFTLEIHQN